MLSQSTVSWSIGLGHWWGTALRAHLLLLLGCLGVFVLTANGHLMAGVIAVAIWVASVALHDLAHTWAASRLGGYTESIMLGPAGGLESPLVPDEPEPQVFAAFAGLLSHLTLLTAATGLLLTLGKISSFDLFTSFLPLHLFTESNSESLGILALQLTVWLNWKLFLLNWIPVYPFDAAPMLRSLLWPMVGRRSAVVLTSRLGLASSALLLCLGLYYSTLSYLPLYTWGSFLGLAFFVAISAQRELVVFDQMELDALANDCIELDDEELSVLWLDEEPSPMVLVEKHQGQQKERNDPQRKTDEEFEDAQVDDILARLHGEGFEHLPDEDQALLRRASQRYRQRRSDGESSDESSDDE